MLVDIGIKFNIYANNLAELIHFQTSSLADWSLTSDCNTKQQIK